MSQHIRKAASAGYLESSAPLPPPAPANNHGSKRDRILEAALKLFANETYQAVTMDRVARAAGVAKGTLYLYFPSKEALYLGILSDGLESVVLRYQAVVEPRRRYRRAAQARYRFECSVLRRAPRSAPAHRDRGTAARRGAQSADREMARTWFRFFHFVDRRRNPRRRFRAYRRAPGDAGDPRRDPHPCCSLLRRRA